MNTKQPLFGSLLRKWREDNNLTQADVVNQLLKIEFVIDRTTFTKYESGHRHPHGEFFAYMDMSFDTIDTELISKWIRAIGLEHSINILDEYYKRLNQSPNIVHLIQ